MRWQLKAILVTLALAVGGTLIAGSIVRTMIGLRSSAEEEAVGLDLAGRLMDRRAAPSGTSLPGCGTARAHSHSGDAHSHLFLLKMPVVPHQINIKDSRAAVQCTKILLLEDDEMFKGIITDFLTSNFYELTAVTNGVEGVRAVLKQDFDVIICDMMMPKLPGDMFYTAVERMRPHLCKRFIFITGHRGNPKINDFIKNVKGTMLAKPFHMDDLLEAIAFVQVKTAIR